MKRVHGHKEVPSSSHMIPDLSSLPTMSTHRISQPLELEQDSFKHDNEKNNLVGIDAKKRRGRAAPPGRCYSCNRSETPKWRRGPDGQRTLCNSCGLHYAKLTRKSNGRKNANLSARPNHSSDPKQDHLSRDVGGAFEERPAGVEPKSEGKKLSLKDYANKGESSRLQAQTNKDFPAPET